MSLRHSIIALLLLSLPIVSARAQSGPQTTQSVVAGGGGTSAAGSLQVEGTAGQSVTGASSGGSFALDSGFWPGATAKALANLSVDNQSATYGGTLSLKATLSATGANPSGKLITFALNGTNVGTATTDANGLAILNNVSLSGINAGTYATGITAEFAGDVELTAGNGVGQLTVAKADPSVSVTGGSFTFDGQPHPANASATGVNNEALGPISLLYNGTINVPVNAGSYAITATFAGNQNYNAATNNQQSIIIGKANQAITFGALSSRAFGDADFTVNATASSGLAVSFTATGNCNINANTVHITGAGSCTITADSAADNNHNAAPSVAQSFNIAKATTTANVSSSVSPSEFGQNVTFTANVSSTAGTPTGTVQFKVDGSNAGAPVTLGANGVATFSPTALAVGTHTINADYSGDVNFNASTATLTGGQVVTTQPSLLINDAQVTEGNGGTTNAVFTVTLAQASNLTVKVDFSTADSTAKAGTDYQASSGTLTFAPGDLTKTITVTVNGNTINEPDKTFFVNLTNPQNAALNDAQGTGTIVNDDVSGLQLSSNSYTVNEDAGHATITVTRTGDTSGAASVQFATSDLAGLNNCEVNTGDASARCDYTAIGGTLNFLAGESSKTFTVPVINDVYVEGPEVLTITLSNPVGATLSTPSAQLTITDNDGAAGTPNPIDLREFLIRQFYLDMLNREPEPSGLAAWLNRINTCPQSGESAQDCDEIEVASAFFRSPEFFDRAFFLYKFYEAALGRQPQYDEYQRDLRSLTGFLTAGELEQRKREFAEEFVNRTEFHTLYGSFGSGQPFVDALLGSAGTERPGVGAATVVTSNRLSVINRLGAGQINRAQGLRELMEAPEISQRFFNKAFVVVGYFALLRRNPDINYLHWIQMLNTTGDYREMIRGLMKAPEYRLRFGQ
ncbi:MAG TPA: Calx-beta domain-containing protein [Pyrinomonadaceae bacterium]